MKGRGYKAACGLLCVISGVIAFLYPPEGIIHHVCLGIGVAIVGGLTGGCFGYFRGRADMRRSLSGASKSHPAMRMLLGLRFFCSRCDRDIVDLTIRDLNLDIKEMRAEGCSERFITMVVFWRSLVVVATMVWSGIVEPVAKVWASFKAK